MTTRKDLTTGQAGRLSGVCSRMVAKWIDLGLLPAYRIPPNKQHRRIRPADLLAFLREHEMPVPDALKEVS